jgi:hypothetical protein
VLPTKVCDVLRRCWCLVPPDTGYACVNRSGNCQANAGPGGVFHAGWCTTCNGKITLAARALRSAAVIRTFATSMIVPRAFYTSDEAEQHPAGEAAG